MRIVLINMIIIINNTMIITIVNMSSTYHIFVMAVVMMRLHTDFSLFPERSQSTLPQSQVMADKIGDSSHLT